MVSFSTTGLLLHVALFRLGTTHDCAIGQAGPSIWSRLPPVFPIEVSLGLTIARLHAEGQQPAKALRIGYLSPLSGSADSAYTEAFRQGLRELGYVEGKGVVVEARYADGKFERLPDLAAELIRLNVDVIV